MTYSYKNIWQVAAPILAGLIIQQLIGLTDTAFLGHLGEIELGASALGAVFYIVLFMLGHGFSSGVQIIIARRHGEGNCSKTAEVFYQSISFLTATAAVMILLTHVFSLPMLAMFISSPKVLEATIDYVNPRVWGLFFAFIIVNFRAFFIGITDTKALTLNAVVMLVANIILDYGLIFGHLGMPALGIAGSAYASVMSEAISVIFFIIYTFLKVDRRRFGFQKAAWWNYPLLREIFALSFWTTMQSVVNLATWMFFLTAVENLGERELAVSNILRSATSFTFMIIAALSATANSLTSNLIGCGKSDEISLTTKRIIIISYALGIPVIMLLIAGYKPVLALFTDNPQLTGGIFSAYIMAFSSYVTLVPGMVWLSVISGTGRTKLGMNIELASLAVYAAAVWYIVLYLRSDLLWCWSCEHYYNIPLSIITYYYLRHTRRLAVQV